MVHIDSRRAVLLTLALLASVAKGNGGPVSYSRTESEPPVGPGHHLRSGLVPLRSSPVRLVSEDLRIVLKDDGRSFTARAEYVLANAGKPVSLSYGVPLSGWIAIPCFAEGCSGHPEASFADDLAGVPSLVRIELAGARAPCTLALPPGPSWDTLNPPPRLPWDEDAMRSAPGWCVAKLQVPSGDRIPLTLTFEGAIESDSKVDERTLLAARTLGRLEYLLFPAGWWSGPPERLRVVLEAGKFAGLVAIEEPLALQWSDEARSRAVLEIERPDLEKLRAIRARIDLGPVAGPMDLARTRLPPGAKVAVRGSSVLPRQGKFSFGPEHAIDGSLDTAWCEGAKGPGVGEWIELDLWWDAPVGVRRCAYAGLLVVPGYARNETTYLDNGRVLGFRLSPCHQPDEGQVIGLGDVNGKSALSPLPERSATRVDVGDADPLRVLFDPKLGSLRFGDPTQKACVRLTILDVAPGRRWEDTCLSELRPLITCRELLSE